MTVTRKWTFLRGDRRFPDVYRGSCAKQVINDFRLWFLRQRTTTAYHWTVHEAELQLWGFIK